MLSAAIIASIPAATSVVNTLSSAVLDQVREGSESFAAALSDALQPPRSNSQPRGASPLGVKETFDDLVGSLRSHTTRLGQAGESILNGDMMNRLRELIRERLQSAGIDNLQGVQFELRPSDGRVTVVGDHLDKALIESTLANDPTVADAIKSIGSALRFKLDEPDGGL